MDSEYKLYRYPRNSPASDRTAPGNTVYLTDGSQAYELTPRRWISRAASFGVPGNDVIVIARSDGPLADLRFDLLQDTYVPAAILFGSVARAPKARWLLWACVVTASIKVCGCLTPSRSLTF